MASIKEIEEAKVVLSAQSNILNTINTRLDTLSGTFDNVEEQKSNIKELAKELTEIEQNSGNLDYSDIADWNENDVINIYQSKKQEYKKEIQTLNYKNWDQFVKESLIYCTKNNIEATLPYESLLTDNDLQKLKKESYMSQFKWDKWDYAFVGMAGILASLTDFFIVKNPKTINYKGNIYEGSIVTDFLKKHINNEKDNRFAYWAKKLEKITKVPYDSVGNGLEGMTGKTHRLQSLGHDPVLGCIFGVLDILRGTLSGFSYDSVSGIHKFTVKQITDDESINFIEACIKQIGHLISDVGTKTGLQPPLFSLFQGINLTSPFSDKDRKIGEIARWMYLNGYDFRHFLTMTITPAIIEIILRTYIMLKHYNNEGEVKIRLAGNPKYRSMLLWAHAIASAGNAGKIYFQQGNPLAINYAEWMAFFRYLTPSVKYWILDKQKLEIAHLEKINDHEWNEILNKSDMILKNVYKTDSTKIKL